MNIKRLKDSIKPLSGILFISILVGVYFVLASFNRSVENQLENADVFMNLVVNEIHASCESYQNDINNMLRQKYVGNVVDDLKTKGEVKPFNLSKVQHYLKDYYKHREEVETIYIHHIDKPYDIQIPIHGTYGLVEPLDDKASWTETEFDSCKMSLIKMDGNIKVIIDFLYLEDGFETDYLISLQLDFSDLYDEFFNDEGYDIGFITHEGIELTNEQTDIINALIDTYGHEVFGAFENLDRGKAYYNIADFNYFQQHIIVSSDINDVFSIIVTKPYNKYSLEPVQEYLLSHIIVFGVMLFAVVATLIYTSQKTKQWVDNDKQFLNEIIDMDKIQISELKKELRFHTDFFTEAEVPLLVIDKASLRIINVNNRAVKFYQYSEDELLEMYFSDICKWDSDSNQVTEILTVHHKKKDETIEERRIRVQEVNFNESEMLVIMVVGGALRDEKILGELKMEMFHEIRSPLQGAYGAVEMIEKASDAHADYTSIIKRSLTNVLMMTDNVLAEGKLSSTQEKVFISEFDLYSMINEVVATTVFQDKHYNHISSTMQENVDDILKELHHYTVKSDPIKLRQILLNLMSNASKYTEDGVINLSMEVKRNTDADIIIFKVTDTGIGLTKKQMTHLFESFKTFASSDHTTSTGIGLVITKKYVELLGSTLHVSSEPGLGTTFSFSIKVESSVNSAIAEGQKKSILVVDDDTISCEYLTKLLENEINCFVKTLTNETMIFSELSHHEYDCLIIDQNLNHFKGVDIINLIRSSVNKRISDIPILLITATKTKHEFRKISEAKLDEIILKPFDNSEVVMTLNEILSEKTERELPIGRFINAEIIDKDFLIETIESVGGSLFVELVSKFKVNSVEELSLINKLYEQEEFEALQSVLHRLKGSMSYFAPNKCRELIQNLEFLALNSDHRFKAVFEEFQIAHKALIRELQMICRNV